MDVCMYVCMFVLPRNTILKIKAYTASCDNVSFIDFVHVHVFAHDKDMDRVVGSPRVFACEADSALRRSPPAHDALSGVNTVLCSDSTCMHESTSPECLIKLLRRCLWRLALRRCLWLAALVESILEHKIRGGQGFPKQLCFALVMELPPMPPPGTNPTANTNC